jgi:hypothetical protein
MTERMVERAGNDLLRADEYLARVGVKAIPTPQGTMNQQARCPLAAQAGSLCSTEQLEEVSSMEITSLALV